jgi:hypothetical protein
LLPSTAAARLPSSAVVRSSAAVRLPGSGFRVTQLCGFKTRADAVQDVSLLVEFLAKFGLFVHVKLPGKKKSKSVLMYHSAPKASYQGFSTLDIDVGGGSSIHVEPSAPYLGSLLTSDGKDDEDVPQGQRDVWEPAEVPLQGRRASAARPMWQSTTRSSSRCCSTAQSHGH